MKVLQTLGRHGGYQEGIFQYKRTSKGVFIDLSVGQAKGGSICRFGLSEWSDILKEIARSSHKTFGLSSDGQSKKSAKRTLYKLVSDAVPKPKYGVKWNDSLRAAVCAVLEHEGTIDLYHGPLGNGNGHAYISLARTK